MKHISTSLINTAKRINIDTDTRTLLQRNTLAQAGVYYPDGRTRSWNSEAESIATDALAFALTEADITSHIMARVQNPFNTPADTNSALQCLRELDPYNELDEESATALNFEDLSHRAFNALLVTALELAVSAFWEGITPQE